jgi:PAS domain S-box-containing protein
MPADALVPEGESEEHAKIVETLRAGFVVVQRTTVRHRAGHSVPVELSGSSVPGAGGPAVAVFLRDITARLEADRELRLLAAVAESSSDAIVAFDWTVS